MNKNRAKQIKLAVMDLVSDFLYYDRKEDATLYVGSIEEAIHNEEISIEEIVSLFEEEFRKGIEGENK